MRLSNILLVVAVSLVASSDYVSAAADVNVASPGNSLSTRSLGTEPSRVGRTRFLRATETAYEDEERAIWPWINDLIHFKNLMKYFRYVDYFNWAERGLTPEQVQKIMKISDKRAPKSKRLKEYTEYFANHKPGIPPIRIQTRK